MQAAVGERFGRYALREVLGGGGFASVYRAFDTALRRDVAVKALLPHLATDPEIRRRFLDEGQALASMQHSNIVTVFDVGEEAGRPFFAMELVDGQTLAQLVPAGRRMTLPQALTLLRSLCSALDYVHGAGYVHRDIKPANIMVDLAGRVVLMDFGIVRALDRPHYTQSGVGLGTPTYMAPEQVRGEPVGAATDVYGLGILTYHLLVGHPPFQGDTAYVLHAQVFEPPPPLRTAVPGLPAHVYHAVDAALSKRPDLRPRSAGAFLALLSGEAVPTITRPQPTPQPQGVPSAGFGRYTRLATAATPALIIYVLDVSASMSQSLGTQRRVDVVREALNAALGQMVFRSTKGSRLSPRYRVAMLAYSDDVYDVIGGVRPIDEVARLGVPELRLMRTTNTARAFAAAEQILLAELPHMQDCPAPLVCHMTDGRFTGEDPAPIARRIMQLAVPDGNVLIENIFIAERVTHEAIHDATRWAGICSDTPLADSYTEQLLQMTSPLPESYRESLRENNYHFAPGAMMLLPGTSRELVALGFQMSAATPVR